MIFAAAVSAAPRTKTLHARIDDLIQGWSFETRAGLQVVNVRVRNRNVVDLFEPISSSDPSFLQYYFAQNHVIRLQLARRSSPEILRAILIAENTDRISISLRDFHLMFWQSILPEDHFNTVVDIIVETPCDEITRVIYELVESRVRERVVGGQTEKHIQLDQLFEMLLKDKIEPYVKSLEPIKQSDPCFKTFRLLKWLRGEDVSGFDFGEYRIHEGLRNLLQPALTGLIEGRQAWTRNTLEVNIVGFTDPVAVAHPIPLSLDATGVSNWGQVAHPLEVRYGGCIGDTLTAATPVYFELDRNGGLEVGPEVTNNCKLGAARSYITTAYVVGILGRDGIRYRYATGGIHGAVAGRENIGEDPTKRKVDIEFVVRRAKEER
jgi:hypothetical protein